MLFSFAGDPVPLHGMALPQQPVQQRPAWVPEESQTSDEYAPWDSGWPRHRPLQVRFVYIFVTIVKCFFTSLTTPVTVWSPMLFSQWRGWTVRGLHCHWFEYRALWRGRRLWRLWLPQEDQRVAEGPRWDPSKIILDNLMIISETQVR